LVINIYSDNTLHFHASCTLASSSEFVRSFALSARASQANPQTSEARVRSLLFANCVVHSYEITKHCTENPYINSIIARSVTRALKVWWQQKLKVILTLILRGLSERM